MIKLPRDFQIYIVGVVGFAALLLWYLAIQIDWQRWPEMTLFVFLIGLATMFPIPDPHGGYIMATPILFYVLFSTHSPGAALLIAGVSYATGAAVSLGWVPWRMIFNGAQIGISVAVAGLIFHYLGGSSRELSVSSFFLPMVVAALVHQFTNNLFVASYYSRLRRQPLLSTWFAGFRDLMVSNLFTISSAVLLAALYVAVHPLMLLLYLPSLPVQRWALQLYLSQRQIHGQAIESLVVAIDAHFPQGRGHSRRVADIATAVGRKLNLSEVAIEGIELGALLHDVGLIGIDDDDTLDPSERALRFRNHTVLGWEIARDLPHKGIAQIVLYHHERFDGSGYPRGLRGPEIPLGARIVALAEVYDSMVSGGFPRSAPLSRLEIVEAISVESGRAFDPRVVQAFQEALQDGLISHDYMNRLAPAMGEPQVQKA